MESYFKVFYTDVPVPKGTDPHLSKLIPFQFQTRQRAVEVARKIIKAGGVVWQIEEPGPGPIIVGPAGSTTTSTSS